MKKKRQAEILRIISTNEVETQEMLLSLLRERGYEVTQATVSRDINELNIEKTVSANGYPAENHHGDRLFPRRACFCFGGRRAAAPLFRPFLEKSCLFFFADRFGELLLSSAFARSGGYFSHPRGLRRTAFKNDQQFPLIK